MNVRREVSSCASRPIEALVWVSEIESAKTVADLKTSCTITGATLQSNVVVLDSTIASGFQQDHQRRLHKKSLVARRSCTKRKTLSHGKAGRMGDLRVFQGQRVCLGPGRDFEGRIEEWQRTVVQYGTGRNHHRDEKSNPTRESWTFFFFRQLRQSEQLKPLQSLHIRDTAPNSESRDYTRIKKMVVPYFEQTSRERQLELSATEGHRKNNLWILRTIGNIRSMVARRKVWNATRSRKDVNP